MTSINIPLSREDVFRDIKKEKEEMSEKEKKKKERDEMKNVFGTFRVEDYIKIIPTYQTIFFSIKKKYSCSILHFYEKKFKPYHTKVVTQKDIESINELETIIKKRLIQKKDEKKVEEEEEEEVEEEKKEEVINAPVFVRLSTRSPKDAIVNFPEFESTLKKYLNEYPENEVFAVIKTQHELNKCNNEKDVIKFLTHSSRVYDDLMMSNLFNDDNNKLKDGESDEIIIKKQKILLRSFDENLKPELEFRCFVKYFPEKNNYKITAITQYYKICYVQYIKDNKKKIEENIKKKIFNLIETNIKDKIKQSFVVDVGVQYDSDEVTVIELNPFSKRTGPCFFNWEKDEDIIEGEKPFEFRIKEKLDDVFTQRKELNEKIRKALDIIKPLKVKEEKEKNKSDEKCIVQ